MEKKEGKKNSKLKIWHLFIIVLALFTLSLFLFDTSLSRYVYNGIKNYFFQSKGFYFNCDKLSEDTAVFQLDNWDGVNTQPITFNMNSYKNNLISADEDIYYTITKSCTGPVTCELTKNSGLIDADTHEDSFSIRVTPNYALPEGTTVTVEVTASSTEPYEKELSGVFTLNVGVPGITYEIVDKVNQPYLNFSITNTLDFYRAVVAFGNYSAGDTIESSVYETLSDTDKAKCTSALIKLEFDPHDILIDMTSEFYENAYDFTTTMVGGKEYIDSVTFGMEPVTSMVIRFYKVEASMNYTYPFHDVTPIITFNAL